MVKERIHFPKLSTKPCFNPYGYIPNQDPEKHGSVYLSPRKPYVVKYFFHQLFELEIGIDFLRISQILRNSYSFLGIRLTIDRYDKNNTLIDHIESFEDINKDTNNVTKQLPPATNYCYAIVQPLPLVDPAYMHHEIHKYTTKNKGFAYIECSNGIVRVNKKILSKASPFFKKLFHQKNVNKYHLDIDFSDLMWLVLVLPPFDSFIDLSCPQAYGSLYVLSEQLKCIGIADMCARFMIKARREAPLYASSIAYEAGVFEEAQLYIEKSEEHDVYCKIKVLWEQIYRFDKSIGQDRDVECAVRNR